MFSSACCKDPHGQAFGYRTVVTRCAPRLACSGAKAHKGKGALEMTVAYSLCAAEGTPIISFDVLFDSFDLDLIKVFDFNS